MKTKEKKDFLENIYFLFEKAFQDHKEKIILKNYKLINGSGITREIDIYIEYKIGYKTIKYAIECKNHKSGIPMKDITDLDGKLRGTDVVGLFVSISRYQSGAVKEAAALGIKLYQLEKASLSNSIKGVFLFKRMFKIIEITPIITNNLASQEFREEIQSCETCNKAIETLKTEQYFHLNYTIDETLMKMHPNWKHINQLTRRVTYENGYDFNVIFEYSACPLVHKGTSLNVKYIISKVRVWEEPQNIANDDPFSYTLKEFGTDNIFATINPMQFEVEGNKIISTIISINDDEAKIAFANADLIQNVEIYDAKSMPISETNLKDIFN